MSPAALLAAAARAALLARRPRPARRPFERVLVLGYAAVGDLIFFLPVLEALRAGLPGARLSFVANRYPTTEELLPATGLVDEIKLWDWEGEPDAGPILNWIEAGSFDAAVLTLSSPAHYFQGALAGVPVVAGHRFPGLGLKRRLVLGDFSRAALGAATATELGAEHSVARNLRLLEPLGLRPAGARPGLGLREEHRRAARALLAPVAGRPLVAVHPGPVSYNRRDWAPEKFGALMALLYDAWPDARFVLLGSKGEEPRARAAAAAAGAAPVLDLCGRASLLETFAVIEACGLTLAPDTGLSKASMALGVPTATLWGPSSPVESGAWWDPERHLDLSTGIECAPCSFSGMPREGRMTWRDCGHRRCLDGLEPGWAAERILARPSLRPVKK